VRILQLTDFYHPVIGGLEQHVRTLSAELTRLGHTVTVVALAGVGLPDEEVIDGVRVIRIRSLTQRFTRLYADSSHPFHPTAPDPAVVAALRGVLDRERPDIVHSHSWVQYSFFPLYHARRGPAHVVTMHDYGLACARKTLMRAGHAAQCAGPRLVRCLSCAPAQYGAAKGVAITAGLFAGRFLLHRADRYIAVSTAVAEGVPWAARTRGGITVIPTMVPNGLSAVADATSRPGFLPGEDGYLMFVGALGAHKGVDVLLEARRRMRHRVPLVLVGTPRPDTPPIDDPGLIVARNVPNAQVMTAWKGCSVALVPSVWDEPMGQVAVEAMLVGRPVVASDVGGLRDVVEHGITGLRVPPGDPGALAAAVDGLLDDPGLRQRMGEAGRDRARRFEAAAVAPQVLAVFEDALRDRAKV
jgi:glycosyltransferase involved in cell wall biosynthesis